MNENKVTLESVLWLVFIAFIWGITNPLIKKSSRGIERIDRKGRLNQFFGEITHLISNPQYLFFLILNQSGSLLFYLTLSNNDLSLVVPVVNFLTFVFTGIASSLIGESPLSLKTFLGMTFVTFGVTLCIWSKTMNSQ